MPLVSWHGKNSLVFCFIKYCGLDIRTFSYSAWQTIKDRVHFPWRKGCISNHFYQVVAHSLLLSYCYFPSAAQTGGIVAELLTYLIGFNSCLNPWIYFCFNCKNFVIKPRKRKLHTNLTMTTQTQLNTERASIQLSQSCSNKELQEELTPLTETRAIVIKNRDAVHV